MNIFITCSGRASRGLCAVAFIAIAASAGAEPAPLEPLEPVATGGPTTAASDEAAATQPAADATDAPQETSRPFDLLGNERLLGDLWGARPWLGERGISVDLGFTSAFLMNARGGRQTRHAHRWPGRYDLELSVDTEPLGLWRGGKLYARAEGGWADSISDRGYVPSVMALDNNVIGNQEILLAELWYEQSLLDDKLRIRIGRMAPALDFDTNAYANDPTAQFLNAGLNNTQNLPAAFFVYPLGLQIVATPCEWFYAAAGVYDAQSDNVETGFRSAFHRDGWTTSLYEIGLTPTWETPWGKLPGAYRVGLWYDPQTKPRYFNTYGGRRTTAPLRSDDVGFYTSLDQMVWRENPAVDGDDQGLGLFARYGYARGDVNEMEHFWSAGGQYLGLIPTRDSDVLGIGVAQAMLSPGIRYEGRRADRETVLEVYYNIEIFPWLHITPDMQWIFNPGGEDGGREAVVLGFRVQMTF
ncbi:MAG: carbohydrate porin [Phycisphaerales bacterium]|nr:carbohydrate porin [Phycisphaerales bacterium]